MLGLIAAVLVGACEPVVAPTAEMYRAEYGKPDKYEVSKCGGGHDEYGKRIAPWKCLVWFYDGKGYLYFATQGGERPYVVTGCGVRKPLVTQRDGPLWVINTCLNSEGKSVACNSIGFGLSDTADWQPPPDISDEFGEEDLAALTEHMRSITKVCSTKAEARQAARECAAPAPKAKSVAPAAEEESDPGSI